MRPAQRTDARAQPGRILVVDDSRDNLEILATRLRFRGYAVETAASGEEALARVAENPPDLILLDIMMPEMDGLEVTRRLRSAESTQAIPIIAITAMQGARELALEAGANDVMAKPIDIRSLLVLVRDRLAPEVP